MALFSPHPAFLQAAFSDLKRRALEQDRLLIGSPGSVSERIVSGRRFLYRQYYDARGKKTQDYVGAADDPTVREIASRMRESIASVNALTKDARPLVREGYVAADSRTAAILAAARNAAFFESGGVLVGSHAFGALLNDLGARAGSYATHDVDLACDLDLAMPAGTSFPEILAGSTLDLHPIPAFDRNAPSTSYKPRGTDRFRVDLLVPSATRTIKPRLVRSLDAHATALPFLDILIDEPMTALVLSRDALVPVSVPRPETYAIHKMIVARLRHENSDKREKDLAQAATLFAVLAEQDPGALENVFDAVRPGARSKLLEGARVVLARLEDADEHPRAIDLLRELSRRSR